MEAAAIITLISAGHWLEARVSDRASGALKSLLQLAPQTARRIYSGRDGFHSSQTPLPDGDAVERVPTESREIEIPVSELQTGDLIALRPGDRVPVDGVVTEGDSAVDEAMLTGESAPVDKKNGSELFAGTANLNGRLVMRVTATGEATALAHVIAAVQRAQTSRADIQRLGDRISSVFVPAVVAVAIVAGLWWGLAPESANKIHDCARAVFLARACARRRGGRIHHRGGGFDRRVPVRDGFGDAGGHHGRRQCRRAARHFDSRRRGFGKSGKNYSGDF